MLLPSVSVFPAMMNGGKPEGWSVYTRKQWEKEDYSKLLLGSVKSQQLKPSIQVRERLNYSHIHTQVE